MKCVVAMLYSNKESAYTGIPLRFLWNTPDSKIHGANMEPIWGWQEPCGSHVDPMGPMLTPWTLLSGTIYLAFLKAWYGVIYL